MKKTVTVVGLGYVGQPLFETLAQTGNFNVWGYDIEPKVIDRVSQMLKRKRWQAQVTSDPSQCLPQSHFIIICVPTPITKQRQPDFTALTNSVKTVTQFLKKGQTVVVESTIYPGVCEEKLLPGLEKSGLKAGVDFDLSHCPERINPGDKKWTIKNIPRNVGSLTKKGAKKTADFYRSFLKAPITELDSLKEAECTKMVENVFRDVNIAFVNELAMALDQLDIDAVKVIEAASNKPFSFLAHYPGVGVGGDCIATDPYYYLEMLKQYPVQPRLVKLARSINANMPTYVVGKLLTVLKQQKMTLSKTPLAVLGLSYKPGIADLRNSPALEVVKQLTKLKAQFETYDPLVPELSSATSVAAAVDQVQVVVVGTAHPEIVEQLTPTFLKKHGVRIVIDGRNCLNKTALEKAGLTYVGVGR